MSSDARPQLQLVFDADTDARARAVEELRSFIVQAPAGSGKTELLVQRYLALLATVDEPEAVVAITFTRKAQGEMHARVLKALAQAKAGSGEPEREHEKQRWRLAQKVLNRDRQKGWNLAQNPSRLRIMTIDSLCHGIVKLMPWTSELGVPRTITEDARDLCRSAAHRTVQLLGNGGPTAEHVQRALEHLDNDVPQLEELISVMLQRRDQWLRHMHNGDTRGLRQEMEATLQRVICEKLVEVLEAIPVPARVMLAQLGRFAAENLSIKNPDHEIMGCRNLEAFPACSEDALGAWCGIASMLLIQEGKWRSEKGINAGIGFPPAHRREKDLLIDLIAELRSVDGLGEKIHSVRNLPPAKFSDEQWRILESFAQLLPAAAGQLRSVFAQEQTCDFSEIAQAAQLALGVRESPTDLALALGHDIHHLLVDEFQDTSISQVRLLETLVSGWKPGDGRTIFVVGDPMQSIYRFRQAEVGSFLHVRETEKLGKTEVEVLTLAKNFRSQPAIVDWVNRTFPEVFPQEQDIAASAVVFEPCQSAARERPELSLVRTYAQFDPNDSSEDEAAQVLALVRSLRARGEQVAILVRSRSHLTRIVPRLREASESDPTLRFQAVEIDTLDERIVISDLRALTYALLHLGHRVAWLAVLRAPWCGLSLHDLHVLCGDRRSGTIWGLLHDRINELSPDGRRRVQSILPALTEALEKRGRLPLRHWIEATWMSLRGPACLREKRDLEDASAFFDLLDTMDSGSDLESLAKLEDAIKKLYARPDPEATDAIQVMTIHKAKGLEFDAVILPGLARSTGEREPKMILWDERSVAQEPELLMAAMPAKGGDSDGIYDFLEDLEAAREDNELRRLLYVAATRAKHELYLFGHVKADARDFLEKGKKPERGSLLHLLWPTLREEFERQARAIVDSPQYVLQLAASADPGTQRTLRRFPANWAPPSLPPSVPWKPASDPEETASSDDVTYDWAGERARRVGTVVHAVLQRIAEEGLAKWSEHRVRTMEAALRSALANQGVSPADMDEAMARTQSAITAALGDARGRWVLESHDEAQNEFALTGIDGGQLYAVAMDRTFVADGVRWIVDYKTSAHEGGNAEAFLDNEVVRYKEKMDRYARILKKQDPRPVKIGLYFPLMRGWREWEN